MSRVPKFAIHLLVLTLAVPAGLAAASPADPASPATVVTTQPATASTPAQPNGRSAADFRKAITRATSELAMDQGVQAPIHTRAATHQVRQQGGGSKAGMITALVATVGGLIGTVYMINYMKDQENKATQTAGS